MGSSNLLSTTTHTSLSQTQPCLYTNLSKLNVTCEKTNKIDIDSYFQLMKDELVKHETPDDRYHIYRSMSSGKIERERKRKTSKGKGSRKHSVDGSSSSSSSKLQSKLQSEKDKSHQRTRGYFSYDLSGQVVEVGEHRDDRCLSKQKSWDLSSSKAKGEIRYHAFGHNEHLHRSHSDSDVLNHHDDENNGCHGNEPHELEHARSMESFNDLNRRHMESAHGKIYSVSHQNRRNRRRYFRKERAASAEKVNAVCTGEDEDISLEEIFRRKVAINDH